jgi:hypothetical protein
MLVFNVVFDLLWTGRSSSVGTIALVGLCDLNLIEKHGSELSLVCVTRIFLDLIMNMEIHLFTTFMWRI